MMHVPDTYTGGSHSCCKCARNWPMVSTKLMGRVTCLYACSRTSAISSAFNSRQAGAEGVVDDVGACDASCSRSIRPASDTWCAGQTSLSEQAECAADESSQFFPWQVRTGETLYLKRKRSYNASNSSLSGSSFDAPTKQISGTGTRCEPLSNKRSFKIVKSEFRTALLALNTCASERQPV